MALENEAHAKKKKNLNFFQACEGQTNGYQIRDLLYKDDGTTFYVHCRQKWKRVLYVLFFFKKYRIRSHPERPWLYPPRLARAEGKMNYNQVYNCSPSLPPSPSLILTETFLADLLPPIENWM